MRVPRLRNAWDTDVGRRHVPTWVPAIIGAAVWLLVAAYMLRWGASWNLDLRVYRAAGQALFHHGAPYSSVFTASRLQFTYPPFALVVLSPLSLGPLRLVEVIWWLVNASALTGVCYLAVTTVTTERGRRAVAVAATVAGVSVLALEPLRSNMDYGQINVLLMCAVLFDVLRMPAGRRGVLTGLAAAVKLTPLVYLAYFVIRGDRTSFVRGVVTFGAAVAVGFAVLPGASAHFWAHQVFDAGRAGPIGFVSNQSWNGVLHRAPFHGDAAITSLLIALDVVTLASSLWLSSRLSRSGRPLAAVFALALAELLISPISWTHHWSWLVLVPFLLLEKRREAAVVRALMAVVLALAVVAPYWWLTRGWSGATAADSLAIGGAVLLFVWVAASTGVGATPMAAR